MSVLSTHVRRPLAVVAVAAAVCAGVAATAAPASAAPASAATPGTTVVTKIVDDTDGSGANRFAYAGPWRVCHHCRADALGGSFHYASRRGAAVTFAFTGSRAVLLGLKGRNAGIATVTLDGRYRGTVNLAATRTGIRPVYATPWLRQGPHQVTLTVTGRTTSRGHVIGVDRAEITVVTPTPAPAPGKPGDKPGGDKPTGDKPTTQPGTQPGGGQPSTGPVTGAVASFSFDDGQSGQYANAGPLLAAKGVHGTFYVISDGMGWGSSNMSASQVRDLASQGNEIGSHSRDHAHLTGMSNARIEAEFADSVKALQDKAGVKVSTCAYPYGDVNSTIEAIAAKYFTGCRGTGSGRNTASTDRYNLKVFYVHTSTSAADIRAAADTARASGSWLILTYHGVGAVKSGDDVTTAQLGAAVDAVKAAGLPVRTVAEVLGSR